jgi:hypothetical protein
MDMLLAFCRGPATNTDLIPKEYSWEELAQRMAKPSVGPKNGSYMLRGGMLKEYTRENDNLLEAELLIIDGDSSFDPQTGEVFMAVDPDDGKTKGNSTPIEVARDALDRLGYKYVIHTTHTNTPGILNKWRAFLPARMKSPAELEAAVDFVMAQMHAAGCYVESNKESKTWAQAWYLPRVKPQYVESYKCFASLVGKEVDVQAAVGLAKRQKAAAEAAAQRQEAPKPKPAASGPSPIEQFNNAATMSTVKYMLEQAGYKFAYKRGDSMRFIAPSSETGTPGVTVFKGTQRGDIVIYSHHGAHDPLSGRLNDAFGVLTRLRHGGNQEAAMAEAKNVVGWKQKEDPLVDFDTLEIDPEDFEKAPKPEAAAAGQSQSSPISANAFVLPDEAAIPPRQWVYGYHLIRRFVSATIAPGGVGKSSLVMTEALAMATGKPLLGTPVEQPLKVWVWCLEDPREELERRIVAIAKKYGITNQDIGGRLFLNSGRDTPLCIAEQERRTGTIIVGPHIEMLKKEIDRLGIDVISIDPFVASHMVSENDNVSINTVMRQWVLLAEQCNIAIELVHHTRKNGDGEVTAETSRGAKALVDATRDTRVLNQMTQAEGERFSVENHRLFFRVYSDKMNLAPPAERSDWYHLDSVRLANGEEGRPGDRVGVPVKWEVPGPWAAVPMETINTILKAIDMGILSAEGQPTGEPYTDSKRGRGNSRWLGTLIMDLTGWEEEAAKRGMRAWLESGLLAAAKVEIRGKEVNGIQVNKTIWSELLSNGK